MKLETKLKTPERYEKIYLPKLEEEYQKCIEWLRYTSLDSKKYIPNSMEALKMIRQLQEFERHFMRCNSLAKCLYRKGFVSMSEKLDEILDYIRKIKKEYQKLYQDALDIEINFQLPIPLF